MLVQKNNIYIIVNKFWCLFLPLYVLTMLLNYNSTAQTYLEKFGQNQIQNRKFNWKAFETDNFRVYHYDRSGKELAKYVVAQSESYINQLSIDFKKTSKDKINIILYNNYNDFTQTNIGHTQQGNKYTIDNNINIPYAKDKFVVYFNGKHNDLKTQIHRGLLQILLLLEQQNNKRQNKFQYTNTPSEKLPNWITEGYKNYTSQPWDEATDKAWKSIIETYPKYTFYDIVKLDEKIAGKAFWKFMFTYFGADKSKALMKGFLHRENPNKVTKEQYQVKLLSLFDTCMVFYKESFSQDAKDKSVLDITQSNLQIPIPKDGTIYSKFKVSPRGADLAYVKWKNGIYQVILKHTAGLQQESVILEGGALNYSQENDPNYPIIAWSNTGYKLAILYPRSNMLMLRIYDATKSKTTTYVVPKNRFDRALSMAIDEDNDDIIISAIRKSQTDLYYMRPKGAKLRNITNDAWDDLEPAFITGGQKRGVLFISNRPQPSLIDNSPMSNFKDYASNVYFYNTVTKSSKLLKCSDNTNQAKISQPTQFGPDNFAYLSDAKGTQNQYIVNIGRSLNNYDSAYSVANTNLDHSILAHQYNAAGMLTAQIIEQGGFYNVKIDKFEPKDIDYSAVTVSKAILVEDTSIFQNDIIDVFKKPIKKRKNLTYSGESDVLNNTTSLLDNQAAADGYILENTENIILNDSTIHKLKPQKAYTGFKISNFSISLDNQLLFNKYQPSGFSGNQFANPPLGGLATIQLNNLMEDYQFTGGFMLPLSSYSGATLLVGFKNLRKRLDWGVTFYHTSSSRQYNLTFKDTFGFPVFSTLGIGKTITNLVQADVAYPLDKMRSIRLQSGFRQDVLNFKSIDTFTHIVPATNKYWSMNRLEFAFDNTKLITTNIYNGTRYKVFAEYMAQLNDTLGSVYNFGFDFRNYQKIHKNLIWALRVAGAHSGGKQKIVYYLGGVDNWINYKQASPAAPLNQESYGFQALANNLRGYEQNARNGNSYAVANTEFRYPILSELIKRPIQPQFLRSLQVVLFSDFGLAWNGLIPNGKSMNKNAVVNSYPISMNVHLPQTEGVAWGYGLGLRTNISNYLIRLDAAWNKDGRTTPILYLSLGTDF